MSKVTVVYDIPPPPKQEVKEVVVSMSLVEATLVLALLGKCTKGYQLFRNLGEATKRDVDDVLLSSAKDDIKASTKDGSITIHHKEFPL